MYLILFIMQNNDVELRIPCQEGTMGKAIQLALVKIRKSMTKASRRIKGSCLKAEKADRGKSTKVFEGNKTFPYDLGKAESCHNSKEAAFD